MGYFTSEKQVYTHLQNGGCIWRKNSYGDGWYYMKGDLIFNSSHQPLPGLFNIYPYDAFIPCPYNPNDDFHTIILGCFSPSFDKLQNKTFAVSYCKYIYLIYQYIDSIYGKEYEDLIFKNNYHETNLFNTCLREIIPAIVYSRKIIFDLTHVRFPFNIGVITLCELEFIMEFGFFEKTEFYVNGEIIDKNIVKNMWENRNNNETKFKDIFNKYIDYC